MKRSNTITANPNTVLMYIDMNSFFASCEQQDNPELRGKPVAVCPFASPGAAVIAPSIEAKRYGVKTGMRLYECKRLCPDIIAVSSRPFRYRQIHIDIMEVLRAYCPEVKAKSIDEAVMNLTSYRLVYPNLKELALKIKADIAAKHDFLKCSIGIGPNSFLSKLGTELQKPDGLVEINRENIDEQLAKLKLTDMPGIARSNERRLQMIGIKTPLEMRHASPALLRKAFGGIVGHYWHCRLNFMEMDGYENPYRAMSATRMVSTETRNSPAALSGLLISLCTRLEQRMVKQKVFCKEASFFIRYKNNTEWDTNIRFTTPLQDAMEIRQYIMDKMRIFEKTTGAPFMLNDQTVQMGVNIKNFIEAKYVTYTLFENKMRQDKVRVVMYDLKDKYGRDKVRKASETIEPNVMKDAIGFGSVKDLENNIYLLEE